MQGKLSDAERLLQAQAKFSALVEVVQEDRESEELSQVEKQLFSGLLDLGRSLLEGYVARHGTGYVGSVWDRGDGVEWSCQGIRSKVYLSVFGPLQIRRSYYYGAEQGEGGCPLDEELQLPERKYSYLLSEWMLRFCVKGAYDGAVEDVKTLLGLSVPKRSMEVLAGEVSESVEAFEEQVSPPEEEGEILVVSVDGKGIPMRRVAPQPVRKRLKKGEKQTKKKMATVGTVYSLEEALEEPSPKHKESFATLFGKETLFVRLRERALERGLTRSAKGVFLADGEKALWKLKEQYFPELEGVLDWYHVSEHLWKAAYLFLPEGSSEAEAWVTQKETQLKAGRVGYLIGGLKQRVTKAKRLKSEKRRKEMRKIIGYFEQNRAHMDYARSRREGYPIGSGVVEAAGKTLVKNRMEQTGMRWKEEGAEALLKLRAVFLNGHWEEFWRFHLQRQAA